MINSNKKQSVSANKKELPCKNYQLEFICKNQKKTKKKVQTFASEESNTIEEHKERWTMPTQTLQTGREDYKAYRVTLFNRGSVKVNRREEKDDIGMTFITQDFPQRKIKTNQHQLFKFLSKLQDNQAKRIKSDQLELKIRSFSTKNHEIHTSLRPHLKLKMSPKWVKSRYCINRDKDHGILPDDYTEGRAGGMGSVVVKNPFRR